MLDLVLPNMDYPSAFSNWLNLALDFSTSKELAMVGPNALEALTKVNAQYLPQIVLSGSTKSSQLPFLSQRFQEGKTMFYLCENKACQVPTEDFGELLKTLF